MIVVLVVTFVCILTVVRLLVVYSGTVNFFLTGTDKGFKFSECFLLWKLAKISDLEEPSKLFFSVESLTDAIGSVMRTAKIKGNEKSDKIQNFLLKLYDFRTKLKLDHENKKGLESTKYLAKGQKLRIILPGHGLFASYIMNNGYEMIIRLPSKNKTLPILTQGWLNKTISVYLWRKGDASYTFDTQVTNSGVFDGQPVLYLAQTNKLLRAQKRRSVRCECNLGASLYFIRQEITDFSIVETEPGYKVILEDISEDGAMIRIGGQGLVNAQIKLQFILKNVLILMYGIVRAVEYNKEINQSRLHFECIHLEKDMKNVILSFVYNVLPQEQKDVFDALTATEQDKKADYENPIEELEPLPLEETSEKNTTKEDSKDLIEENVELKTDDVDDEKNDDGETDIVFPDEIPLPNFDELDGQTNLN